MAEFSEKAYTILEDTYFKILSKPKIDMTPKELEENPDTIHEVTLKMLQMDTANMQDLNAALQVEGEKMEQALKMLEEVIKANPDHLKLLQTVDQALQLMNNFFLMLY